MTASATPGTDKVAPPIDARPRVSLGGIAFDNVTMSEALARIDAFIAERRRAIVVTPNVDHVVRVQRDTEYRDLVAAADLVLADGQPIVWASRLLGNPLCERVAGSDLFPTLCGHAAACGHRVFFLGGAPGAADAARDVLTQRHPALQVVGVHCPPMGFERDADAQARALDAVQRAEPDILFVGLGSPKQERWIVGNQSQYGPAVSIGVGISFSFVAGHVRRAPVWMQRVSLEWLHRFLQEPVRLGGRYFRDACGFLPVLGREWLAARRGRTATRN